MSSLQDTLDSILCKHFHPTTPAHEKTVCLSVFERKCKNNSISADNYKENYMRANRLGKYKNVEPDKRNYRPKQTSYENWASGFGFSGFGGFGGGGGFNSWEDMFGGGGSGRDYERRKREEYNERVNRRKRDAKEAQYREEVRKREQREQDEIKRNSEAHRRRQEEEAKKPQPGDYEYECTQDYSKEHGTIRDCIYTIYVDHLDFNAEIDIRGRWGLDNFVFYCGGNPSMVVEEMKQYQTFKFVSTGKRYANKLNISRLWGIDKDNKEHKIF